MAEQTPTAAEELAKSFHEIYERLAPEHGYETREASAVPWEDVPEQNKDLMIAVVTELMDTGVITHLFHVRTQSGDRSPR